MTSFSNVDEFSDSQVHRKLKLDQQYKPQYYQQYKPQYYKRNVRHGAHTDVVSRGFLDDAWGSVKKAGSSVYDQGKKSATELFNKAQEKASDYARETYSDVSKQLTDIAQKKFDEAKLAAEKFLKEEALRLEAEMKRKLEEVVSPTAPGGEISRGFLDDAWGSVKKSGTAAYERAKKEVAAEAQKKYDEAKLLAEKYLKEKAASLEKKLMDTLNSPSEVISQSTGHLSNSLYKIIEKGKAVAQSSVQQAREKAANYIESVARDLEKKAARGITNAQRVEARATLEKAKKDASVYVAAVIDDSLHEIQDTVLGTTTSGVVTDPQSVTVTDTPELVMSLAGNQWDINVACPDGVCMGLGESFDLMNVKLYDPDQFLAGRRIFKNVNVKSGCVVNAAGNLSEKRLRTYESTNEVASAVAADASITGSANINKTLVGATLQASTGYNAQQRSDIKTSIIDIIDGSGVVIFKDDSKCRSVGVLEDDFLREFKALSPVITNPGSISAWTAYTTFLQRWRTHILVQITYGSRFMQWDSIVGDQKTTARQIGAKACANAEGSASGVPFSVDGCASYSKTEKEAAKSLQTTNTVKVLGGTRELAQGLRNQVTKDGINAFLASSLNSNQGVAFKFQPIWNVLRAYLGTKCGLSNNTSGILNEECRDEQRCINLEAAFVFQKINCSTEISGGYTLRDFIATKNPTSGISTYACVTLKNPGCRSSDGCRLYSAAFDFEGSSWSNPCWPRRVS